MNVPAKHSWLLNAIKLSVCHLHTHMPVVKSFLCLTHVELTEQLQPGVSLRGCQSNRPVHLVQLEDGLLHVALGHHLMPLVIVEGRRRVHRQLHGPVPHVEREGDDFGSCGETAKERQEGQPNVNVSSSLLCPPVDVNECSTTSNGSFVLKAIHVSCIDFSFAVRRCTQLLMRLISEASR